MNIEELYKRKGELITLIEMAQAHLQVINQEILKSKNDLKPEQEIKKLMNGAVEHE